jgi:hypothetical protein
MANLIVNKPATANNEYAPFVASRAVDGTISAISRWVSSEMPAWLQVDLQSAYWVDRWAVTFMGAVGWASTYNVRDFKLRGSLDGSNWFDLDTVTNNSASTADRTFTPANIRFLRVQITKGLGINNGVASIVDFKAYEAQNVAFLSGLIPSIGSLSPAFASGVFNYSVNVANAVSSIRFTPIAGAGVTLKINGNAISNGQQSAEIPLNVGSNMITAEVTASNGMKNTYTVNVVRGVLPSYLSSLTIRDDSDDTVIYTPTLSNAVFNYTASVSKFVASVIVVPLSADAGATVTVNGVIVPRNQSSGPIPMNTGNNSINVSVNSTSYSIVITKLS